MTHESLTGSEPSHSTLGQNIIGLTVNNASLNTNNAEEPIRVVIKHSSDFQVTITSILKLDSFLLVPSLGGQAHVAGGI